VLCAGARREAAFRMILSGPFSGVTPVLIKSSGLCFKEELQKPRWRVAVRRCLEFSRAQRWRAEPLFGFRTIRPLFARLSRATGTFVKCRAPVEVGLCPLFASVEPQRLQRSK
jgi:hypothetical protein